MQKRVYSLDLSHLRRLIWNCCNPDPTKRTRRLDEDMKLWGTEWSTNTLYFQNRVDVEIPARAGPVCALPE